MASTNDFATKKQKPTTDEYLSEPLEVVLARLNNNPNGHQSEEAFIQSVITVRNAKASEKLTCAIAIGTFLLVTVPFVAPSLDKKELQTQIDVQAELNKKIQSSLSTELEYRKNEISTLKIEIEQLKKDITTVKNLTHPSSGTPNGAPYVKR